MATVPFTQYLRPDGRTRAVRIDRPDHIAQAADKIRSHGFKFTCEILSTGDISFAVCDEFGDYLLMSCENGPRVPQTVDALITGFNLAEALKARTNLRKLRDN